VRYGPYTIPAGTMTDPGMIHNKLQIAVQRPCSDCFITAFKPDLVYADGTRANMDTGPMLHHAVWTSQWRGDARPAATSGWGSRASVSSLLGTSGPQSGSRPGTATGSAGTTHGTCSSI
jgi:hypothetical protein